MTAIKTPSSQTPSRETPSPETSAKPAARRERPNIGRHEPVQDRPVKGGPTTQHDAYTAPGAGAHAARHLINDEATPGSGALPSSAHRAGKDVDGGAG